MERIDKILARRNVGSRQDAQRLCRQGRVWVNDVQIRDPGTKIPSESVIVVDGKPNKEAPMFAMYHKPAGVQSTMDDNWGRESLAEVLPEEWRGALHPVGRLDADTTGLLMFCSDGQLTQKLLHPRHAIEREYIATVEGAIHKNALREILAAGVETAEGTFSARLEEVWGQTIRVVVSEGKYRMVRRVLNNAGHPVVSLHRIRYGDFRIGDLEEGRVRECSAEEYAWILK